MDDEYIIKAFESIGIPKMQTTIYLDLLKNKESTATLISKRTKMHRANVYDTLTKLQERNLVYMSSKEGKQIFAALPTDLIINEEKEKIEIQGMDIHKMALLPDKTGDVIEDTARIKITRHYRFVEGDSENKEDSSLASPGKTEAKQF